MCPRVCKGCTGPYVFLSWSSSGGGRNSRSHVNVYCRAPGVGLERMDWLTLLEKRDEHERFELPWAIGNLGLSSIGLWYLLGVPLAAWLAWNRARSRRQSVPGIDRRIAQLDSELRSASLPR
ncbi:MAG: hypothetical protein EXR75_16095 [Myxococcales bacterium]|nr:hypothetical protein [Myxococcales bacterium]